MKKDMGFWDIHGNYIPDIQEIDESEVNMYRLRVKETTYTIPKENIRLLAMTKAMDGGKFMQFATDTDAINFLESIGIEVQ